MIGPSAPAEGVKPFLFRDSFDLAIDVLELFLGWEDKCSSNAGNCFKTRQNSLIFLKIKDTFSSTVVKFSLYLKSVVSILNLFSILKFFLSF